MPYPHITENEIEFIKNNYSKFGSKYCAEQLNRSKSAIVKHAKILGLKIIKHEYPTGFRKCTSCQALLPLESFYIKSENKNKLRAFCKKCMFNFSRKNKDSKRSTEEGKRLYTINTLYRSCKSRAKKRNLPFNLTKEWIDQNLGEYCPVLGIKFELCKGGTYDSMPSADQFIPGEGYTIENCKIISWRANALKSNGILEEFKKIVAYVKSNL